MPFVFVPSLRKYAAPILTLLLVWPHWISKADILKQIVMQNTKTTVNLDVIILVVNKLSTTSEIKGSYKNDSFAPATKSPGSFKSNWPSHWPQNCPSSEWGQARKRLVNCPSPRPVALLGFAHHKFPAKRAKNGRCPKTRSRA